MIEREVYLFFYLFILKVCLYGGIDSWLIRELVDLEKKRRIRWGMGN